MAGLAAGQSTEVEVEELLAEPVQHLWSPAHPPYSPWAAEVNGLEPGRRYAFRCSAINAQGSSGWGPTSQLDTLPGLPFPVDCLSLAAATSTSLRVQWSQPYGQGAPVTGYVLEVADGTALEQQAGGELDPLFSPAHQGPECSATGACAALYCCLFTNYALQCAAHIALQAACYFFHLAISMQLCSRTCLPLCPLCPSALQ